MKPAVNSSAGTIPPSSRTPSSLGWNSSNPTTWRPSTDATAGQPRVGAVLTGFFGRTDRNRLPQARSQDRGKAYRAALETLYPHYAEHCTSAYFLDWQGDPAIQHEMAFYPPERSIAI